MGTNDDIVDALTRHQIGLQRLSSATVRRIVALLRRVDARLVERLLSEDISAISRGRQEALLRDVRRILEDAYENATGALRADLDELARYEGEYQGELFRRVIPVRLEYASISGDQLVAAVNSRPFQGKLLREWFAELTAAAARRMRDAIRMGIVEGRTTDQMIRDIRGTRANGFRDGILDVNRRHAAAAVQTAVNHTANAARNAYYEANRDILKGIQWVSTLDSRTTLICASRDGKVYEVGKGPRPPAHVNCRSTTTPVLKSWRELGVDVDDAAPGTRASMNGQVAAGVTYEEWLRRQPESVQEDVLGVAKARLFRDGGLRIDRFVDRQGEAYTLEELRRREADAWAAAAL